MNQRRARTGARRLASGGLIDRSQAIGFEFDGRAYVGYAGDTLASALLANGISLVGRSFKYRRPRGVIGLGVEETNAIVDLGRGARAIPNQRATEVALSAGLEARSVNRWPSLESDLGWMLSPFAGVFSAGFYYKTFMRPRWAWRWYEGGIRRLAGLGNAPVAPDPDRYDQRYAHCDVLVVGAGPAGLSAALAAARCGARVMVVEAQARLGGALLHNGQCVDGMGGPAWAEHMEALLREYPQVRLLARCTAFGYYDHNLVSLVQRMEPEGAGEPVPPVRERLWRVRAREVVLATGAIERPLVFADNDRPGVMLASAVSGYIHRYAVRPGRRAVVATIHDGGYQTAIDLMDSGADVVVVDPRADSPAMAAARARGIDVRARSRLVAAVGTRLVRGARIVAHTGAEARPLECDLIAMAGGWSPAVHLHVQSGARPRYDTELSAFVPGESVQREVSIGASAGVFTLAQCLEAGRTVGAAIALRLGFHATAATADAPVVGEEFVGHPLEPENWATGPRAKAFVDYQNDTCASDIAMAVQEGFESVEHVKRYTAMGFGTDQGKLGNVNGAVLLAKALGGASAAVRTTTFRPPYTPVSFGALAGLSTAELFEPVRKTALHAWHEEHGAQFEPVGQWLRPWYYPREGEDRDAAVDRECLAVRQRVGIMDASTLGKIDIYGADAAQFLDRIYINAWRKLGVGRCRYGIMLGEDGMVMDDGVTMRLGPQHYLMTTTTGGAASVLAWLERWHQTQWPELDVALTSVTDHWATIAIAGPSAARVLARVAPSADLNPEGFEFMSWRELDVAGVASRVARISFSGELAYEVNVPADAARAVWEAVMAAGEPWGITPYGTEAMHVLRAEKGFVIVGQDTDGSVTPHDLGYERMCVRSRDFVGKRSLERPDCQRPDRRQFVGLLTHEGQTLIPEGSQVVDAPFTRLPVPMIGHVTSSYRSACLGRTIALALVESGHARMGQTVYAPTPEGDLIPARIASPVFYDPQGQRQFPNWPSSETSAPPAPRSPAAPIEPVRRQRPLHPSLVTGTAQAPPRASAAGLTLAETEATRQWILRTRVPEQLAESLQHSAHLELPRTPNRMATGPSGDVLWLRPNEWLMRIAHSPTGDEAAETLWRIIDDDPRFHLVDVSSGQTTITLQGPNAPDTLNAGCPLDLHPSQFQANDCAQTLLAQAPVILARPNDSPPYELTTRRSFAPYVWHWLTEAMAGLN